VSDKELAELVRLTRLYSEKHAHSRVVGAAAKTMEQCATKVLRRRQSIAEDKTMT